MYTHDLNKRALSGKALIADLTSSNPTLQPCFVKISAMTSRKPRWICDTA